jgi:hypothetical protein
LLPRTIGLEVRKGAARDDFFHAHTPRVTTLKLERIRIKKGSVEQLLERQTGGQVSCVGLAAFISVEDLIAKKVVMSDPDDVSHALLLRLFQSEFFSPHLALS